MKISLYFCLLGVALLGGCSVSETMDNRNSGNAIGFDSYVSRPVRSLPLAAFTDGALLGVYAFNTGTTAWSPAGVSAARLMDNQEVKKETAGWTYTPVKYWEAEDNYTFLSYAPYNASASLTDSLLGYAVSNTVASQEDLLVATPVSSSWNGTDASVPEVSFVFRHVLSQVRFSAKLSSSSAGAYTVGVTSVAIKGINSTNNVSLLSGKWQGTLATPLDYTLAFSPAIAVDAANFTSLQSTDILMLLPQTLTDVEVVFSVEITNTDNGSVKTRDIKASIPQGLWESNKIYNYQVTLDLFKPIVFGDPVVTPWDSSTGGGDLQVQDDNGPIPTGTLPDGNIWMLRDLVLAPKASGATRAAVSGYTWYEAMSVCPEGWHLPSDAEFMALSGNFDASAWKANAGTWWTTESKSATDAKVWSQSGNVLSSGSSERGARIPVRCVKGAGSFHAGVIDGVGETISYNTVPAQTIGSLLDALGGDGNYSYQWYKNDAKIVEATGAVYKPAEALTSSAVYTRKAKDGATGLIASGGSWTVTVYADFIPGTIATEGETVCHNTIPSRTIGSVASASGGNGSYSYRWYKGDKEIAGATEATYKPAEALTADAVYTRKVKDNSGNTALIPSVGSWKVTVRPAFSAGGISGSQTVCVGSVPSAIGQGTLPSGGDGVYTYQWLANGSVISGSNWAGYAPAALAETSTFTRQVKNGCNDWTVSGGDHRVTVESPVISAGTISASATSVCTREVFNVNNSSVAGSTCGFSIVKYEWYRDGVKIGEGADAPAQILDDGTYSFTRRAYISTGAYATSNTVTVKVASCGPPADENGVIPTAVLCDGRTWMVRNLNDASKGGQCYQDDPAICATEGRLYTWAEAQKACPKGWHLPDNDEYGALNKCFTKEKWNPQYAGCLYSNGWASRGNYGYWWPASENPGDGNYSYSWTLSIAQDAKLVMYGYAKTDRYSVRCVRN